jgi:hypothetical protein
MREATSGQTVKKQTSMDLVHNSAMFRVPVTSWARAIVLGLALALVSSGCLSVNPTPSNSPAANPPTNPVNSRAPSNGPTAVATPAPSTPVPSSPSPSGSPGTTSSPSGSTAPGTPGPTIDPALAAQIDAVVAQVPPIRELQPTKDVPYQFISRDDFRNYLISAADEDTTPEWRSAEERFLKRLGLLTPDADLNALLLDLYTAAVAAYYQPQNGTFYIIDTGQPFGPSDKITTAHEYTHALQDQNFDLEGTRIKDPAAGDAALAQLSVIEGDATLTSQEWMIRGNLSEQEQLQLLNDALAQLNQDQLANMPLILRRQLEFPYTEGFLFTRDIYGLGGYDAVNQAIQTPPASTEQLLHSDKYYNHEAPVAVALDDQSAALGVGWSNVYQQTMGELNIQVLATGGEQPPLSIPGLPAVWPYAEVAAGWGGDRLNMYENASTGGWLIDWTTAWDSVGDRAEFGVRMDELAGTFAGPIEWNPINDTTIELAIGSDEATLNLLDSCCAQ